MGSALKNIFIHHSNDIDDDVLEACLTMTLPLKPEKFLNPCNSQHKTQPIHEDSTVLLFSHGPFHNNY